MDDGDGMSGFESTAKPSVATPASKTKLYIAIGIIAVLLGSTYFYFNRYSKSEKKVSEVTSSWNQTKSELSAVQISLTVTQSDLKMAKETLDTWQKVHKSDVIITKKPVLLGGKIAYEVTYKKNSSSSGSGTSATSVTVTQAVTATQAVTLTQSVTVTNTVAVTIVKKEESSTEKGSKVKGVAYLGVPSDITTGKLSGLEVGGIHDIFLGVWGGLEFGTNSITSPLDDKYFKFLLGFGTP